MIGREERTNPDAGNDSCTSRKEEFEDPFRVPRGITLCSMYRTMEELRQ
jgi:hypothetical protein